MFAGEIEAPVSDHEAGQTLAAIVRARLMQVEPCSWGRARALIETGRVTLDGVAMFDPAGRPRLGARVEIRPTGIKRTVPTLDPEQIVYADHDVLVVRKPSGLITVDEDEPNADSLFSRAKQHLKERARAPRAGKNAGLGLVQRLDRDTSGLLVFARTHKARKHLSNQLRLHRVSRRYLALVSGHPTDQTVETWLIADRGDGRRGTWRGSGKPPPSARYAVTHIRLLERLGPASLIECRLETGRQHQIRIHLADLGHMLLGENVYTRGHEGPRLSAPRIMLHAAMLGFRHPTDEQWLQFDDPLPDDFEATLGALRSRAQRDEADGRAGASTPRAATPPPSAAVRRGPQGEPARPRPPRPARPRRQR